MNIFLMIYLEYLKKMEVKACQVARYGKNENISIF